MEGTKWFMIQKQLSENLDRVLYPKVTKEPYLNPPAQDDQALKQLFQSWKSFFSFYNITRFSVKRAVRNIILAY